jgi:hypothetical protein
MNIEILLTELKQARPEARRAVLRQIIDAAGEGPTQRELAVRGLLPLISVESP